MKYFWQQKFTELSGLIAFIFVPYYLELLLTKLKFGITYWMVYIGAPPAPFFAIWFCGALSIFIIGMVIYLIYGFIQSNLEKADERASKELGIKEKKEKKAEEINDLDIEFLE